MNIVIVGGGLAGAKAVEELRERGYDGDLTLVGAEPVRPYERPPLSKGLLLGEDEPDSVFVHDEGWYGEHGVDLRLGSPARTLDVEARSLEVNGVRVSYDKLLLATGAQPRRLELFDRSELPVSYLRTLEDSLSLKAALQGGRVLIVGAGWIGLEIAAAARNAGVEVTVVESAAQPLQAVLGEQWGARFADLHRGHGVDLRLGTSVASVEGREVVLADGHRTSPDLVVVGIGAEPAIGLAADAGLATDNGVLVDALLRTDDPRILAAGDVANHDHPTLGRLRVEHWDNAIQQGKHAAAVLLGSDEPYARQPYFFTDQYDLGMEYVGHVGREGFDELVVRGDLGGDLEKDKVTSFWVKDGVVAAGMHVNDWDATDPIRALVGRPLDPRLRDADVPLADLAGE
jgi:NADPH-dependent 2,4-dienoyl-CoA reductase/sulfur reductase-like enzyme